jgi:hypothetical protein
VENIECTQCGFNNRLADEVCQRCGAELPVAAPPHREEHIPQDAESSQERDWFEHFPSLGRFDSVGSVISPTITLFQENIWLITKIIFVIFAPFEIFKALTFETGATDWQTAAGVFLMGLACKALVAPSGF